MHVLCLHWLMSTLICFSRVLFASYVKPQLVKWHQRRAEIWLWGPDMAPIVNACLPRPCSGILPLCGSKLYYLCHLASLFKLLPIQTPPRVPHAHPFMWLPWNKLSKFHENQPLPTCQISCTKTNRELKYYYGQWVSPIPRQGWLFNWIGKMVFLEILARAN